MLELELGKRSMGRSCLSSEELEKTMKEDLKLLAKIILGIMAVIAVGGLIFLGILVTTLLKHG
jgi:hypothetical protein